MTTNPFTYGNPIRTADRFVGRTEELRQIVNRLRSSAHESTSIVGERRIGKTSLLKHLDNKAVAEKLGLSADEFCIIYMDFQGLTDITPERFWQRILQKMERAICNPEIVPEIKALRTQQAFDLFDLEDLFASIADSGLTLVLLLDEFEYVTQNTNFGSDFFGGLRTLAIHHNLPLITATRRELVDLCHSNELKGSPFFNIFANIVLRPFSRNEVKELLNGYLQGTDISFTDQETELVLSLGGGYPFFSQMAAYYLFEAKLNKLSEDLLIRDVCHQFDAQSDPHYEYMWNHSSDSEQTILLSLISLQKQTNPDKNSVTLENLAAIHSRAHLEIPELVKRGLILENKAEGSYHLLSSSFERWITREIFATPGEEESRSVVDAWISIGSQGDSESIRMVLPMFKKKYWPMLSSITKTISPMGMILSRHENELAGQTEITSSVFICYSRKEIEFADRLVNDLKRNGVQTWRDVDNIPGQLKANLQGWRAAVEEALMTCSAMLIVLSPGALESNEVQAEWNHFASRKRPIYPVVAHECAVPFYLKIYQIWDLTSNYDQKIIQLSEALRDAST
ncbi:MAG: TIR domain-containing protein [Anaerolineaceae bacterium]|nr:TIR domain-containing protein [Anaerolineaceae bacterium]